MSRPEVLVKLPGPDIDPPSAEKSREMRRNVVGSPRHGNHKHRSDS